MPKPIPDSLHTVTPFLVVNDAQKLIDFLKKAFDAKEHFKMADPSGRIAHAEVRIGDSMIMIGERPNADFRSMLHLYVADTDAMYKAAIDAGAVSVREPADQFYGDRSGGVRDSFGNEWWLATHIEDVSQEEMERRMAALSQK